MYVYILYNIQYAIHYIYIYYNINIYIYIYIYIYISNIKTHSRPLLGVTIVSNLVPWVFKKILSLEMVKNAIFFRGASQQNASINKMLFIETYIHLKFFNAFVVLCYLAKLKRGIALSESKSKTRTWHDNDLQSIALVFGAGFLYTFSIKTRLN